MVFLDMGNAAELRIKISAKVYRYNHNHHKMRKNLRYNMKY